MQQKNQDQIVQIGVMRWRVGHKAVGRVIAILEQVGAVDVPPAPPEQPETPPIPEIKTNADDSKKPDMVAKPKRNAR